MVQFLLQIEPSDLVVHLQTNKEGQRTLTVNSRQGFCLCQDEPIVEAPDFEAELFELLRPLGLQGVERKTRAALEEERAVAVRELGELKALFHQEQSLAGSLTEKVSELEGEKAELETRLALVEGERTELLGRVTAYDNAAREMSKMRSEANEQPVGDDEQPKTNPGGRPNPGT